MVVSVWLPGPASQSDGFSLPSCEKRECRIWWRVIDEKLMVGHSSDRPGTEQQVYVVPISTMEAMPDEDWDARFFRWLHDVHWSDERAYRHFLAGMELRAGRLEANIPEPESRLEG